LAVLHHPRYGHKRSDVRRLHLVEKDVLGIDLITSYQYQQNRKKMENRLHYLITYLLDRGQVTLLLNKLFQIVMVA
jgi:hypothetical protein